MPLALISADYPRCGKTLDEVPRETSFAEDLEVAMGEEGQESIRRAPTRILHHGLVEIRDDVDTASALAQRCLHGDYLRLVKLRARTRWQALSRIIPLSHSLYTPFSRCRYFNGLICSFGTPVRIALGLPADCTSRG